MCKKAETEGKREEVCSIYALHLSARMSLSRRGSFRMHMGREVEVERVRLWSGDFLVVLDVSGPEPECHIPLSG